MRRRTKAPTRALRARRRKLRALLEAAYAEIGSKTKQVEHECSRLDSDPVLNVLWENERDATYDRL